MRSNTEQKSVTNNRPHGGDIISVVAADVRRTLEKTVVNWTKIKRAFEITVGITIRDGLPQLLECESNLFAPMQTGESEAGVEKTIAEAEKWISSALCDRIVIGYHGRVSITVSHRDGELTFSPMILNQKKYDWNELLVSRRRA